MSYRLGCIAATLGAALCAVTQAGATTLPSADAFTTYASWKAALNGSPTDLNFSSVASGHSTTYPLSNFTFSGSNLQEDPSIFEGSPILITAPAGGETAMILFIEDQQGVNNATSFTLTLSDGETSLPISLSSSSPEWYGFTVSSAITTVNVTSIGGTFSIGDLWFGTAKEQAPPPTDPIPEAGTFVLTCGGLLILLGSGRALIYKNAV